LPRLRDERGEAESEHDGVGPADLDGPGEVVDAGREDQVLSVSERLVDIPSDESGAATKNFWSGSTVPVSAPVVQPGRTELVRRLGTQTPRVPPEAAVRNGGSWVTGLDPIAVYGPPHAGAVGKHVAGAPLSPEKTWFQTPFVQPSMLLLRTRNCCWDPLTIVERFSSESAMKPPLANDGLVQ
jgi:hypothetical protein